MRGIKDKVVIVTGGAGGIGAELCRRFAGEGAKVAVFDLNAEAAERVAAEIKETGASSASYAVDISNYQDVAAAVARAEEELGPIDILVNNAGWDHAARFLDTEPLLWEKLVAINLMGPLNLQHTVVKGMVTRGGGRVVNVASDAGRVGSSGESVYSACKGCIIAFSKALARELARKQINVNVV